MQDSRRRLWIEAARRRFGSFAELNAWLGEVQRKPGALRNGAPFADMLEALQQLRRGLLRQAGGDRVMAQVLAIVPAAGLDAVIVAVESAMESCPPSGRVSVENVINVLGRLNAPPVPLGAETALHAAGQHGAPRQPAPSGGGPCVM